MSDFKKEFFNYLLEQSTDNTQVKTWFLQNVLHEYFASGGQDILKKLLSECIGEAKHILNEGDSEAFLNTKETCAFLKIGRTSLFNHSKNNPHFPKPKHIGRRIVYSKKSLIDYLNRVKYYQREPP
jgi:predicted DNA-binding transcriptional regulator AlpA